MIEHLDAESDQWADSWEGSRNGSYEQQLATRVRVIELEVP
jgi:transposase-like protein